MLRRTFLKGTGATLIGTLASSNLTNAAIKPTKIDWSNGIKPLYCLAYIDPEYSRHKGQESFIAKYPITVIPQDSQSSYFRFRNRLRAINPQQKVLAYQVTLDENELRGPGHEQLRNLANNWLTLPGGMVPTINVKSGGVYKNFRIYDPRNLEFRQQFVDVCKTLISQHGFDGIFLDNCTIYGRFSSIPYIGNDLINALQQLINEVRNELPDAILIGNSRYNWVGLNGEMNEGRPAELPKETEYFSGHVEPIINMYHYYMKSNADLISAEHNFRLALANRCFFGTGINAQTIRWYKFFDRVLSEYEVI